MDKYKSDMAEHLDVKEIRGICVVTGARYTWRNTDYHADIDMGSNPSLSHVGENPTIANVQIVQW